VTHVWLGKYLAPLALWVVTALYLIAAYGYAPDSRAFPAMVAWTMIVLLSLDVVSRTETAAGRAVTRWLNPAAQEIDPVASVYPVAKQAAAILWVAGFAAALVLVGVLCAIPAYVFASLRWRGGRPVWICALTAGGATLFVWALFSLVLRLQLYPGLLFGGL
jgi:hypothetical protein